MTGALERVIDRASSRRAAGVERCGLCGGAIAGRHRHVLEGRAGPPAPDQEPLTDNGLLCVCVPCTLLFGRDGAGGRRYELIPDRRTRLTDLSTEPLRVPVGLAYFVKQTGGSVLAHYPSPLGTTWAEVSAASWLGIEAGSVALAGMRSGVEALLVWTRAAGDRTQHWILGIDECYRLAALVRRHWTGMSGGTGVWREVAGFFADLNAR